MPNKESVDSYLHSSVSLCRMEKGQVLFTNDDFVACHCAV